MSLIVSSHLIFVIKVRGSFSSESLAALLQGQFFALDPFLIAPEPTYGIRRPKFWKTPGLTYPGTYLVPKPFATSGNVKLPFLYN